MKKPTRRDFIKEATGTGLLLAGNALGYPSISKTKTNPHKPNLVYIFSDQQSFDMLGCYGNKQIITPHIDQLAREGARFNHCISNSPICTPYRGILMTGQHPLYNGAFINDMQLLPGANDHFGDVLENGGYQTAYIGKWHLYGGDRNRAIPSGRHRHGFDDVFLSNNCTVDFRKEHSFFFTEEGKKEPLGEWEAYGQTRQAVNYLDRCKANEPFAMFVSVHPPHNHANYDNEDKPKNYRFYRGPEDTENLYNPDTVQVRPNCEDTALNREMYAGHMAMITAVDRCVGRIIEKLKQQGLYENTLIVFTSDHGDALFSNGFSSAKSRPENVSCKVPFILRYPKKIRPRVNDIILSSLDIMPTLLGLMNLPIPAAVQGSNLSTDIINGNDDAVESTWFFSHCLGRGVYTKHHTYSCGFGDKPYYNWQKPEQWNTLYDNIKDPYQKQNLFNSPEYTKIKNSMHHKTIEWMDKFGDKGWGYNTTILACVNHLNLQETGNPLAGFEKKLRSGGGSQGTLKGRPIDILRKIKS